MRSSMHVLEKYILAVLAAALVGFKWGWEGFAGFE